jgi:hypothetical protein
LVEDPDVLLTGFDPRPIDLRGAVLESIIRIVPLDGGDERRAGAPPWIRAPW